MERSLALSNIDYCKVVSYLEERRCKKGGYCFYRLEEPNLSDTFYAIKTLALIKEGISRHSKEMKESDGNGIAFLSSFQKPDGSFATLNKAYFVIAGLRALHGGLFYDARGYLCRKLRELALKNLTPSSFMTKCVFLLGALCAIDEKLPEMVRAALTAKLLSFRNSNGSFGSGGVLMETGLAIHISHSLGVRVGSCTFSFVDNCENDNGGFTNTTYGNSPFLEHTYAGLLASRLLGVAVKYPDKHREFIFACQTRLGGFSRVSNAGIATIENTYYALASLHLLENSSPANKEILVAPLPSAGSLF